MDASNSIQSITVFLDNNAWDFFYARGLNPCEQLPSPQFKLMITREGEFEIDAIPSAKQGLKDFIQKARTECIQTQMYFGFASANTHPSEQRVGGFGQGVWVSKEETEFIHSQHGSMGFEKKASTRLYPQEADISLAARSLVAVVLTCDSEGALKRAASRGGRVVNLLRFDQSGMSVKNFILAALNGADKNE